MEEERRRGSNNPQGKMVSGAEIQNYLSGVAYPASKNELVNKARERGAPREIVDKLRKMPEDEFGGPEELMEKFGEMER